MEAFDVLVVGGGPAGLAGALALGRARKRVLVCDSGPPRNARAKRVYNFVTRDGTPPAELRAIGRAQLATYPNVTVREANVTAITKDGKAFRAIVGGVEIRAPRVLLATGVVDEIPAIPGLAEIWGHSAFQCPYCHGWEVANAKFGVLATSPQLLEWGPFLRGWTRDLVLFTNGAYPVDAELRARVEAKGVRVVTAPIERVLTGASHDELTAIVTKDETVATDVLFLHPQQRQVPIVASLGLSLDDTGYVRVENGKTSVDGVYAAGDLTTRMQAAIVSAAAGTVAAAMLNHDLTVEMLDDGTLPP